MQPIHRIKIVACFLLFLLFGYPLGAQPCNTKKPLSAACLGKHYHLVVLNPQSTCSFTNLATKQPFNITKKNNTQVNTSQVSPTNRVIKKAEQLVYAWIHFLSKCV